MQGQSNENNLLDKENNFNSEIVLDESQVIINNEIDKSENINMNDYKNLSYSTNPNVNITNKIASNTKLLSNKINVINNTMTNYDNEKETIIKDKEFNKEKGIFLTATGEEYDKGSYSTSEIISYHDLIVPGGKNSRLCIIHHPLIKYVNPSEVADHYKFHEPCPVINLIGANTDRKGKLMAGISRAAYNTKAIIVDSGLQTGLEPFCIRCNIPLIGICPESMIDLPKPNFDNFSRRMLSNGHTHFILLGNKQNQLQWGNEIDFKTGFITRLTKGRKGYNYICKTVGVVFGNINNCIDEIIFYIDNGFPLILIEDSELSILIKDLRNGNIKHVENNSKLKYLYILFIFIILELMRISEYNKLIEIENDSENLSSAIHLCLTISF